MSATSSSLYQIDSHTARIILQPGVYFTIPGNRRRSQISGKVLAVKKVNFTYSTFYFDQEMILTHRLDDCAGMKALSELKAVAQLSTPDQENEERICRRSFH